MKSFDGVQTDTERGFAVSNSENVCNFYVK